MSAFLLAAVLLTGGIDRATCQLSDDTESWHRRTSMPDVIDTPSHSVPSLVLVAVRSSENRCAPHISAIDDEYMYLDDGSVFKESIPTGLFRNVGKGSRLKYTPKAPPHLFEGLPFKSAMHVLGAGDYVGLWSDDRRSIIGTFVDEEPATVKSLATFDFPARSISFSGATDTPVGMIYLVAGASSHTMLLSYRWDHRAWRW